MQDATDDIILARALAEDRNLGRHRFRGNPGKPAGRPPVILFRNPNLLVESDYATMLVPALSILEPEIARFCVAVFRNGRLRDRRLPLV
jgi:hypothetical protein